MSDIAVPWKYPVEDITEDRRVPRSAVGPGFAPELVGYDGTLKGGLRPSSGFQKVHELDFQADANHDETSEVIDLFPIDFKKGTDSFAFGFVYRAKRKSGSESLSDVFIDYYDRQCQLWVNGTCLMSGVDPTKQMDVTVTDRKGLVFVEGRSPVLFFLGDNNGSIVSSSSSSVSSSSSTCTDDFSLKIFGKDGVNKLPGPGLQTTLLSPEKNIGLGNMRTTGSAQRPGAGQVVLTLKGPSQVGLFDQFDPSSSSSSSSSSSLSIP